VRHLFGMLALLLTIDLAQALRGIGRVEQPNQVDLGVRFDVPLQAGYHRLGDSEIARAQHPEPRLARDAPVRRPTRLNVVMRNEAAGVEAESQGIHAGSDAIPGLLDRCH